jgi:hypothetical protein
MSRKAKKCSKPLDRDSPAYKALVKIVLERRRRWLPKEVQ